MSFYGLGLRSSCCRCKLICHKSDGQQDTKKIYDHSTKSPYANGIPQLSEK